MEVVEHKVGIGQYWSVRLELDGLSKQSEIDRESAYGEGFDGVVAPSQDDKIVVD